MRGWHVDGRGVRPDHRIVAHMAFRTTARRLAEAAHIADLKLPRRTVEAVVQRLAHAQVRASVRGESLRVSPYVFNTSGDVAQLVALDAAL